MSLSDKEFKTLLIQAAIATAFDPDQVPVPGAVIVVENVTPEREAIQEALTQGEQSLAGMETDLTRDEMETMLTAVL